MTCMIFEHDGIRPRIASSAYVAPNAVVCGDVTIGEEARILFGATLTADGGPIEVGTRSIVMENALVRGRPSHPAHIGANTLVGPHAHINGAQIDDGVFLATGVSAFPGARVGGDSEVRINAVVHVNAVIPARTTVPIGWIAVGDPARLFAPDQHDEIWAIQRQSDFPGTVFGISRADVTMEKVAAHYADFFGRHRDDRRLD